MRKNVFAFGSIAGLIISAFMTISMAICSKQANYDHSMLVGYTAMLIAFSFVFIGIKNYRDKYNDGLITFGKAFKTGIYITLIASTFYVVAWLIEYYMFIPDFMDIYGAHMMERAKASGASEAELAAKKAEMLQFKEMYKNPLFVILFTYFEILPVGLLVTLISALILRRKAKPDAGMA